MREAIEKFGHEESAGSYRWYQWTEDEIAEYMDTVSSLSQAEDRAELGLITDAKPVRAGDFMIVELVDKKEFSKFTVLWSGSKEEPQDFDPSDAGDHRPVAINMAYYGDAPVEDEEDGYEEDAEKYHKDGKWCVQAVAFYVGDGVEDSPEADDEVQDEAGYMKEDEKKMGYTSLEKNAFICHNISKRQETLSQFGYGITTADKYVGPIVECSSSSGCSWSESAQKLVGEGGGLDLLMKRAAGLLVYSNEDMGIKAPHECVKTSAFKEFAAERIKAYGQKGTADIPKGTLMLFENVVTTAKQDRDGDVLRSEGADIDPMMPLLWQHVQIEPIGKMVKVLAQSEEGIVVLSAIVDVNPLSQDAAKMVEAGMLRISHGFRPLEFRMLELEQDEGKTPDVETPQPGFDIKKFEIMEESLVSVPANTDAVITMYSQHKFASPLAKSWAKGFYDNRPRQWKGFDPFAEVHGMAEEKHIAPLGQEEEKSAEEYKEPRECTCGQGTCENSKEAVVSLESISTERLASALCARLLSSDIPKDLGTVSKLRAVIETSLPNVREALIDRYR